MKKVSALKKQRLEKRAEKLQRELNRTFRPGKVPPNHPHFIELLAVRAQLKWLESHARPR